MRDEQVGEGLVALPRRGTPVPGEVGETHPLSRLVVGIPLLTPFLAREDQNHLAAQIPEGGPPSGLRPSYHIGLVTHQLARPIDAGLAENGEEHLVEGEDEVQVLPRRVLQVQVDRDDGMAGVGVGPVHDLLKGVAEQGPLRPGVVFDVILVQPRDLVEVELQRRNGFDGVSRTAQLLGDGPLTRILRPIDGVVGRLEGEVVVRQIFEGHGRSRGRAMAPTRTG
jgi:hypothetical protein